MTSNLQDPAVWQAISDGIVAQIGADRVTITSAQRLQGGSVQQNWRIEAVVEGGPRSGAHSWVLRSQSEARLPVSLDAGAEAAVLRAAHAANVIVAEPVADGTLTDGAGTSRPFVVQNWLAGGAQARRIVRDPHLPQYAKALASDLAEQLARIHRITPQTFPGDGLGCLPLPLAAPAKAEVARYRAVLEKAGDQRPALEYVLAWLDRHAPPPRVPVLVHGDFRTGNYLVDNGRLSGILDWEFAHWGDPDEDIGWLSARCWRFGNDEFEAGGIAPLDVFLTAYKSASDRSVSLDAVRYWQIMAAARWAAIAVLQGDRLRLGSERRLELALTGLMPAEMEHDALREIIAWSSSSGTGGPSWQ